MNLTYELETPNVGYDSYYVSIFFSIIKCCSKLCVFYNLYNDLVYAYLFSNFLVYTNLLIFL
jgi:hypothetical protein